MVIGRELSNLVGRSLKGRYLIIESDDWGSVRMPSRSVYRFLKKKGLDLGKGDAERYNKYDSLATKKDLEELFNLLSSFRDSVGRHPTFTALSLVANPDFNCIKDSNYENYFWSPLDKTFAEYGVLDSLAIWKEGITNGLFHLEFHGREHLNVDAWLRALRKGDEHTLLAFGQGCWGFRRDPLEVNYQAAFDLEDKSALGDQSSIIKEGLIEFERVHGYRARFFVPPNGPFNNNLQKDLKTEGIDFLSTSKIQYEPLGNKKFRRRLHYLGKQSSHGLTYLTRNAFFEPSARGKDWVASCLGEIESAFRWHKPAVISTHRVNYIGVHDIENRDNGLTQLKALLSTVVNKWPDVRFLTSTELGDLLTNG